MTDAKKPTNRDRFLKVYVNLPLNVREEVVCVIDDKPITWNVAYLEVKHNTKLSEEILDKLDELEII